MDGVGDMGELRQLSWDEHVHVDGTYLGELVLELGVVAAREVVNDAIGVMGADLAAIEAAMAAGRTGDLVLLGDGLSRVAWEVGLTTLSAVAVDLALCAERGDLAALEAVHARLRRIGGRSLSAAWDEAAIS